MENHKILVVDDDVKTVDLIRMYLEREGFQVFVAYDGREALEIARHKRPHLLVLDLMLPKVSGLDVCRILRYETQTPMIMLTAKTTEDDILLGLDLGADDYITKPFSPRQLVARARAVLRRTNDIAVNGKPSLCFGDLEVDSFRHEARLRAQVLHLTPREFKMLETLAKEPGRAFSRMDLLERVFGYDYKGLERTVDAHIMNLRKKITPEVNDVDYIQTVYGIGYKFVGQPTTPALRAEGQFPSRQ